MTHRKRRISLLGLLAVAALAMAAFASSAHAVLPQFVFKNKAGTLILALLATIGARIDAIPGTLLVPALNLEVNCTGFTVKQPGSEILAAELADANILFEGCTALSISGLGTKEELPCHVSDVAGGKVDKLHIQASAIALPIEFASGDYGILFEEIKSIINFLSGTGCALPLKNVVKGEVCALIETSGVNANETVEPLILFSQAIQEACPERKVLADLDWPPVKGFKDELLYGANPAFIDGSAFVKLEGAHEGFTLGVLLH